MGIGYQVSGIKEPTSPTGGRREFAQEIPGQRSGEYPVSCKWCTGDSIFIQPRCSNADTWERITR